MHNKIMKGNASFNPCQLNIFFTSPESLSTELNKGFEITRFYTTKEPCVEDNYSYNFAYDLDLGASKL